MPQASQLQFTYFSIVRGLFIYPEVACVGIYLTSKSLRPLYPPLPLGFRPLGQTFKGEGEDIKKEGQSPS